MTTLYRPVLIESAEQAEGLTEGTVAFSEFDFVRERCHGGWTGGDGDALYSHTGMTGYVALVPIEAEEVWGSQDKSGGISRAHAGAEDPHATVKLHIAERTALGHPDRLVSHYVTPWEEAQ